jgi:hypothetical protein
MYEALNAKFSHELVRDLFFKKIAGLAIKDAIDIHNAAVDYMKDNDDDGWPEYESDDHPFLFREFAMELVQGAVYKTHLWAISQFESEANHDIKMLFAILAIETSIYMIHDIPEKEIRRTRARYGNIKNACHVKYKSIKTL